MLLDPKEDWAVRHLEYFPVEINRAPMEKLLRVPGIGVNSAKRIVAGKAWSESDLWGFEKNRGCFKEGVVFYYLQWQDDVSREIR